MPSSLSTLGNQSFYAVANSAYRHRARCRESDNLGSGPLCSSDVLDTGNAPADNNVADAAIDARGSIATGETR